MPSGLHKEKGKRTCLAQLAVMVQELLEAERIAGIPTEDLPRLTKRETQVLNFAVNGLSPEQIALRLGIKLRTVRFHLDQLRGKLGANSRDQLMARAGFLKLCDPYSMGRDLDYPTGSDSKMP